MRIENQLFSSRPDLGLILDELRYTDTD